MFPRIVRVPTDLSMFVCINVPFYTIKYLIDLINLIFFSVNRQVLTKILSPFDDSVDKNPVVRSVVLKLLLKYR